MKKSLIFILVCVAFLGIVVWAIIQAVSPRATLIMSVAPDKVSVTINGEVKEVQTGDKISVTPGELLISISRNGFDTYTENIKVENREEYELLAALNPFTNEARQLLNTEKSQTVIQRIANKKMEKSADELVNKYPIISALPIKDKFYTITICSSRKDPNDTSKIAICIYLYNPDAKQSVINAVIRSGYNLKDYEHYFINSEYKQGEVLDHHH